MIALMILRIPIVVLTAAMRLLWNSVVTVAVAGFRV